MLIRLRQALVVLLALLAVAVPAGILLLGRVDLGGFAAARASAALGREVRLASLRVTPGRWIGLQLEGGWLGNIDGGTAPAMAELGRLEAEVDLLSLLRGPVVVRRLSVDGLQVLLERAPGRRPNWRFGPAAPAERPEAPADRAWLPTLLETRVSHSELVFRTTGGKLLRSRIEAGQLTATGAEAPLRLEAAASYNGMALTLEATLGSIAALRQAGHPFPTDLHFKAGETRLDFSGGMTAPLDVDGAAGRLALRAPDPAAILAIAGTRAEWDASLELAGPFERRGDRWEWRDATGLLDGIPLTAALLRLVEGGGAGRMPSPPTSGWNGPTSTRCWGRSGRGVAATPTSRCSSTRRPTRRSRRSSPSAPWPMPGCAPPTCGWRSRCSPGGSRWTSWR
ncbi:hypothetical protein ACFQY5_00460 [Paeniroseomonas aquatica]|uniref:AsmA family protein n=1 Tax=Paeniroseomonas aquatica TaxID=373043 RepID=UPI00361D2F16